MEERAFFYIKITPLTQSYVKSYIIFYILALYLLFIPIFDPELWVYGKIFSHFYFFNLVSHTVRCGIGRTYSA